MSSESAAVDVVKTLLGSEPIRTERLLTGLHNWVYGMELASGDDVVVRIGDPASEPHYRGALHWYSVLTPLGVPLPKLIGGQSSSDRFGFPVAPPQTVDLLREDADEVICVATPSPFWAIGEFYDDFTQTSDDEVVRLLETAAAHHPPVAAPQEKPAKRDPLLEHAAEEAEGIEYFADPGHDAFLTAAREEAQGIEVFADPDANLPATALREGDPGHESLTGDDLGLGRDGEEDRRR